MGDPTEMDKMEAFGRYLRGRVRTWLPGVVQAYNPATGRARIAIGLLGGSPTGLAASGVIDTPTVIPEVPVVWSRGAGMGDFGNLVPGDTGMLCFASRAIDLWLIAGGFVPLESDRMHELIDAAFIPGVAPLSAPPPAAAALGRLWGREDGTCTITANAEGPGVMQLEAATIRLGQAATHPLLLADSFLSALATFVGALSSAANIAAVNLAATAFTTALGAAPMVSTKSFTE